MASSESDIFRSRSGELSGLQTCPMKLVPTTQSKAFFALQIPAGNSFSQYPTGATAFASIIHHQDDSDVYNILSLLKGSAETCVSFRTTAGFSSRDSSPPSVPNSAFEISYADFGKNTHIIPQPVQMPTFGPQASYASLKKEAADMNGRPESHAPSSIRNLQYYNTALTEPSATNREGLGGFQTSGYEHLNDLEYSDQEHPSHSAASVRLGGSFNHPRQHRVTSGSQLPQHYQQGGGHVDANMYDQQGTLAVKMDLPVKIDTCQDMNTTTWIYPIPHQMYQNETPDIVTNQQHLPPHSTGLSSNVVHLALSSRNGAPPENASSRSQSPGFSSYTFQSPAPNSMNSTQSSIFASGGVSITTSSNSSFNDTDHTSEGQSPNNSPYLGSSRGALRPPPTSGLTLDHYSSTGSAYLERTQNVQLLHCSQCTQRFASNEHFAKHQIKHQKLHRCRISGCNRVEGFTTPNDRDRHEKSVHKTPGVYFRCMDESCASYMKTFARRDNLKDHLKRMHKMPQEMDDTEANEKRNELADSWRVDLGSGSGSSLTPPGGV